jgi:mannose-6-phosphate isomerase-like protein (cupin superfamily)
LSRASQDLPKPYFSDSSDLETFLIGGLEYAVLVSSAMTGGVNSLVRISIPSGGQIPKTTLRDTDSSVYIVQGRFDVTCAGRSRSLGPGDSVFIPRGHESHVINTGESGSLLRYHTPALDQTLRSLSHILSSGSSQTAEKLSRLLEESGISISGIDSGD